jgi:hypothetical protein
MKKTVSIEFQVVYPDELEQQLKEFHGVDFETEAKNTILEIVQNALYQKDEHPMTAKEN